MISKKRALEIMREEGCSPEVIKHVEAVTEECMEIARKISEAGHELDLELVRVGALLHDIGRSQTHDISHGVIGAKILRERGFEEIAEFAENHLGAGIPEEEAKKLDIPTKDYLPQNLEQKIVTYGDNLLRGDKTQPYEDALDELKEDLGPNHPSVERFRALHAELKDLGAFD